MRRGLGTGWGKGYRNLIPHDRPVHQMSAKGIKQPQRIPEMMPFKIKKIQAPKKDFRFEQLSKEIVFYVQQNSGKTQQCIDFIRYELYLRCISKDFLDELSQKNVCLDKKSLQELAKQEDDEGLNMLRDNRK